ncbi:hypothetical protein NQ318_014292 [Aromia moschata]|uniref:non-specific protein-tyrosine kinase n=1 Tax=Aromia moschata TaxID=1265417 RepID=A0AAV8Z1I6_9CUCU|nr:hypothetical protein NQ318_014292 [Aromia moschata]
MDILPEGVNASFKKGPGLYEFLVEAELQQYFNSFKNTLKITHPSQLKFTTEGDLMEIGMSKPEMRRLRKYYEKHFPHNYLSKFKKLLTHRKHENSVNDACLLASTDSLSLSKAPRVSSKHIIPAASITINKELGMGEFGVVQQGVWCNEGERIQVQAKVSSSEGPHMLMYRVGDVITVLDKKTHQPLWKGTTASGKTGLFDPMNIVAYLGSDLPSSSFLRTDSTRSSSRRKLRSEMISAPQGDFKHTGHVGLDGAYFGDLSFLGGSKGNYGSVPTQVVAPYRPHKDLEAAPLLEGDQVPGPMPLQDHEYHEISDEENANSPSLDLGPSLMAEMEMMFSSLGQHNHSLDHEGSNRSNELREKMNTKSRKQATVKPISAHDQKTLDTAIAMANEITTSWQKRTSSTAFNNGKVVWSGVKIAKGSIDGEKFATAIAYRLEISGHGVTTTKRGLHTEIFEDLKQNRILNMWSDRIGRDIIFHKPYRVIVPKEGEGDSHIPIQQNGTTWCTDGSNKAEITAISACAQEMTRRSYTNKRIQIISDSQAALKALGAVEIHSQKFISSPSSLDETPNHTLRLPLWDKASAEFYFAKSRELLSRPFPSTRVPPHSSCRNLSSLNGGDYARRQLDFNEQFQNLSFEENYYRPHVQYRDRTLIKSESMTRKTYHEPRCRLETNKKLYRENFPYHGNGSQYLETSYVYYKTDTIGGFDKAGDRAAKSRECERPRTSSFSETQEAFRKRNGRSVKDRNRRRQSYNPRAYESSSSESDCVSVGSADFDWRRRRRLSRLSASNGSIRSEMIKRSTNPFLKPSFNVKMMGEIPAAEQQRFKRSVADFGDSRAALFEFDEFRF